MKVCSLHFKNDDFFFGGAHINKINRLRKTAVPSQNLPVCSHDCILSPTQMQWHLDREQRLQNRAKNKSVQKAVKHVEELPDLTAGGSVMIANTPPSGRSLAGRKRVLRKRSATVKKLKKVEEELAKYRRKVTRYKTKYYKLKRKLTKQKKKVSPRSRVEELTKGQNINKEIKQRLIFGEVLKIQLQHNFETLGGNEVKCDLIKDLQKALPQYMVHVSNMKQQYKTIRGLKKNLNHEVECLIHVDFSENYTCKYFREVQSAHFGGAKPQISTYAVICDGPSTQYRNKSMFQLIGTELVNILGIEEISWNYFESGHGKGAVDGVGGRLKRTADRLVACGYDIQNFVSLISHLKDACPGIHIETVVEEDFTKFDNTLPASLKPFKGTMKVHQVCWADKTPKSLSIRRLSCGECSFDKECKHYGLGNFEILRNSVEKLNYSDVYSDSDAENESCRTEKNNTFIIDLEDCHKQGFIVVEWPKNSKMYYIGQIQDYDKMTSLLVNFMKRIPSLKNNLLFIWPEDRDQERVDLDMILTIIKPPQFLRRERYVFDDQEILRSITLK
ncbi:hypothetical protein ILUMI_13703 [Ignelater luminosus]|uniref:THAP-type domain-containing protein n=1 Tax=Ignelater luminosus TaxID=2038154 RepID=A0A8K0GAP0_IGNLU|nr:hypothetical protein ILUMI_13703 [Ignelater luminosus]